MEVWDWDSDGGHDAMGSVTTNLQGLLEGQGKEMDLEVLTADRDFVSVLCRFLLGTVWESSHAFRVEGML